MSSLSYTPCPPDLDVNGRLVIGLESEDESRISLHLTVTPQYLMQGAILLFSSYCLRQIVSLGIDKGGSLIAGQLLEWSELEHIHEIIAERGDVADGGDRMRKRFEAELRLHNLQMTFQMHLKGFGFLGAVSPYVIRTTILDLICYLAKRRHYDTEFIEGLANACGMIGNSVVLTRVGQADLGMINQKQYALGIALNAMNS